MTCSWRGVLNTTLCDKVCQWLATGWWFSPGTPVSSTNKSDRHELTEILLNTINQPKPPTHHNFEKYYFCNYKIGQKSSPEDCFFFLFLKRIQINFIFADNVHKCILSTGIYDMIFIVNKILVHSFFHALFITWIGLGLGCWTPLSTIFHLYRGGQIYRWRKREYPQKTTDLPQVTDKLYHIMLYRVSLAMSGIRPNNDCSDRYLLHM